MKGIAEGIPARGLTLELDEIEQFYTPPSSPVNIRPISGDNHLVINNESTSARSLFERLYCRVPVKGDGSCLLKSILCDTEAKSTIKVLRNQGSLPSQHSRLVDFFRSLVAEKMKEKLQRELSNCWSEETQKLDFSKASSDKASSFLIGVLSDKCELDSSDKGEIQRVIDQYVNTIKTPGYWLGQNEIIVISEEILRRPIYIYDHEGSTHWEIASENEVLPQEEMRVGAEFDKKPTRIRFTHGCHYESVLTNKEYSSYLESQRVKIAKQLEKNTELYSASFNRVDRVARDYFFPTRHRCEEDDGGIFSLGRSIQYQTPLHINSIEDNNISLAKSAIERVKGTEWLQRLSDAIDAINLIEPGIKKERVLSSLAVRMMDNVPSSELNIRTTFAVRIVLKLGYLRDRTLLKLAKQTIRNAPKLEWNAWISKAFEFVKLIEHKQDDAL